MTFKHDFLQYEDIASIESDGGQRYYTTPDGSVYPSVTTVLSRLSKDGIDAWRKRVGEEEANKISKKAADRGTVIHRLCEQYLRNNTDFKKGEMPIHLETFKRMQPLLDMFVGTIYGLEIPLYSHLLKTAGRTDCIAEYRGKLSIIDFKTSKRPKREDWIQNYFVQATCYAMMAEKLFNIDIPQIVVIIAVDNEDPQIFRKDKSKYTDRVMEIFQ